MVASRRRHRRRASARSRCSCSAILIELSHAQALVLFEWLSSHEGAIPIDHPAEQDVLWRVEGELERQLPDVLSANYAEAVRSARREVHGGS